MRLTIDMPGLRTRTPGNGRRHWRAESRDARAQRLAAKLATLSALNAMPPADREKFLAAPRMAVRLVRTSPRRMDVQNLFGALKHAIDGVADAVGVDDGSPWWDWQLPTQESGQLGVRVVLEPAGV